MVNSMLLFRGRQTREMSSFLQPMGPTEPRMLYFRNYLACAKILLEFLKSVVPKHLTPKVQKRNRISIMNLVNPESRSLITIPS